MSRVFKLEVTESLETLEALLQQEKDIRRCERLQCLSWYKTGQAKTRHALGNLLNRSQFALGYWSNTYRTLHPRGNSRAIKRQASPTGGGCQV